MERGTRIALVLPGAAALGAYEAGAVYELLLALQQTDDAFSIDLIVGTSAGALTGSLAAHSLARNSDLGCLHDAWVDALGLVTLLNRQSDERGLLSGQAVRRVADRYLTAPNVATSGQAVRLAITLTDLDGQWYELQVSPDSPPMDALDFAVHRVYNLSPTSSRQKWQEVRDAACASAAFPGVFPAVPLTNDDGYTHWYNDGGVANRRLLEIAIDHSRDLDLTFRGGRLFLFVEPSPLERPAELGNMPEPTWLDQIVRSTMTIPFHSQIYDDLRRVVRMNERVRLAAVLDQLLLNWVQSMDVGERRMMLISTEPLVHQAIQYDQRHGDLKDGRLQVTEEMTTVAVPINVSINHLSDTQRQLFRRMRYLVYVVAGLADKTEIQVDRIAPEDAKTQLAGDFWGHFGGLARSAFREHDFRLGRQSALRWLANQGISYPVCEEDYQLDPSLGAGAEAAISSWEKLWLGARVVFNGYRAVRGK